MILYSLVCDRDHAFDAWFRDSATCEAQLDAREIACPLCGSGEVRKALMAPAVAGTKREAAKTPAEGPRAEMVKVMKALRELRRNVEANCDYVGGRFPEEARRMHYGESETRGIYGEASAEDTKALADEGIEVAPLPWLPREN